MFTMVDVVPLLRYWQSARIPRQMSLERMDTGAVLTFGMMPRWVRSLSIGGSISNLLLASVGVAALFTLAQQFPGSLSEKAQWMFRAGWAFAFGSVLWAGFTILQLYSWIQCGNEPMRWGFDEEHFVVTQPGWFGIRRSQWKLAELTSVEVVRVKGLLDRWSAARLVIRIERRRFAVRVQAYGKKMIVLKEFGGLLSDACAKHQIRGTSE